ncbi:LPXTG cell wall anchor domain-containing protein [Streptomyces sp. NPDC006175]|uniref:LPXTG cell wall anchor domain-containing protein n=1 Tax=Streptomyces sp. NPDC006175 TaxID=3154471 RepID=UPI0033AFF57E
MKQFHRVLATAAVTAVIGPVALFTAQGAYAAGEDPSPSVSSSPTTVPEPSPTTATPTATATVGTGAGETSAGETSADEKPATGTVADPTAATESAKPGTAEPSPTYTRPAFCSGIPDEERGKTSLRGLPSKIVAGSGWHDFTYRVTNVSTTKVMETDVSLYLGTADPDLDDIAELAVTVEWFNPATDTWKPIEGEGAGVLDNDEFATVKTLGPGEYADARMRIKVGASAKAGDGYFFTIGHSYGEDGQCGFDDISQFDFTVLAPGSEPGAVEDSEGKPGAVDEAGAGVPAGAHGGNKPAPQGELGEIPVSGKLAETGSSSTVATTAALGAAAVALGAGAVFVVRRRGTAGSAS